MNAEVGMRNAEKKSDLQPFPFPLIPANFFLRLDSGRILLILSPDYFLKRDGSFF